MAILAADRDLQLSVRRWLPDMDFFEGVDPVSSALARHAMESQRPTGMLLTDKHNPIDFYRAEAAKRWRNRTAEILGPEAILR
jgi:hypothetical protein